jgi:pyridoxine kinase
MMGILSIQSQVVSGFVGNSAAAFGLQRCGREVWQVPTVLLSHHPGHGGARGEVLAPALLRGLVEGIVARGCFARCEAVVSGYLGSPEAVDIVLNSVQLARASSPKSLYLCDPVLGDDGRTYVGHEIVTRMHNLASFADILTPNEHELFLLTGIRAGDRGEALRAVRALAGPSGRIVVLTGFRGNDTPDGAVDVIAVGPGGAWRVTVPFLAQKFSGAGDLFAALFLHFWLALRDLPAALRHACAGVHAVLAQTLLRQADELALIEAQHQMLSPGLFFTPEPAA